MSALISAYSQPPRTSRLLSVTSHQVFRKRAERVSFIEARFVGHALKKSLQNVADSPVPPKVRGSTTVALEQLDDVETIDGQVFHGRGRCFGDDREDTLREAFVRVVTLRQAAAGNVRGAQSKKAFELLRLDSMNEAPNRLRREPRIRGIHVLANQVCNRVDYDMR